MNALKANIHNLTSLWKSVSLPFGSCHTLQHFDYAWLNDSEWPNRLWFNQPIESLDLNQIRLQLIHLGLPLKVPYWSLGGIDQQERFLHTGFEQGSTQVGMSLDFDQHQLAGNSTLDASFVTQPHQAETWSQIFKQSFGYYINPKQLIGMSDTFAFVYTKRDKAVGTGLLHLTGEVAGIHAIGVLPDERRKGHAEQIMHHLLEVAFKHKCKLSTLQASELGKGLYLKLGYREDFLIHNFKLKE